MNSPAHNPWRERASVFTCCGEALLAVICEPAAAPPAPLGVLIVVGGPQYRAGSHRQFVQLARALASAGHACMRFDVRGMGDSGGDPRSFESLDDDIAAALDHFQQRCPDIGGFVLWGLCDGASAALMYLDATQDTRVHALALANPWVRTEASLARTQVRHYYWQRLREPGFWSKLLRGGVGAVALRGLVRNLLKTRGTTTTAADAADPGRERLHYIARMARGWERFAGPALLTLSGQDYTAKEFLQRVASDPSWGQAWASARLQRLDLPRADHTFSDPTARHELELATVDWLARLGPVPAPGRTPDPVAIR